MSHKGFNLLQNFIQKANPMKILFFNLQIIYYKETDLDCSLRILFSLSISLSLSFPLLWDWKTGFLS